MPPRSKVLRLPPSVKQWLDKSLIEGNFCDYEFFANELTRRGYKIGKSSVNRYGIKLECKLASIRASTKAAKEIAAAAPEDADQRTAAVISMVQNEIFEVLVALKEAAKADDTPERVALLGHVAKSVTELSRASINQKKWQAQERTTAEARSNVTQIARAPRGVSPKTIRHIRKVLGIESN